MGFKYVIQQVLIGKEKPMISILEINFREINPRTHLGLLQSRSELIIPPPQLLEQLPNGDHLPQPPLTGTSFFFLMHFPSMHH